MPVLLLQAGALQGFMETRFGGFFCWDRCCLRCELRGFRPPHGDWAMCCGFGVEARAGTKKSVRRGGREFFGARKRCTARIALQSPVTLPNHRALRLDISIGIRDGAGAGVNQRFMALEERIARVEFAQH